MASTKNFFKKHINSKLASKISGLKHDQYSDEFSYTTSEEWFLLIWNDKKWIGKNGDYAVIDETSTGWSTMTENGYMPVELVWDKFNDGQIIEGFHENYFNLPHTINVVWSIATEECRVLIDVSKRHKDSDTYVPIISPKKQV